MFNHYKKSAIQGCAESQFCLGFLYENSDNDVEAKYWYEKAAKQGLFKAYFSLGFLFAFHLGDFDTAKYWFKKSKSFVGSRFYLGHIYELENNIENAIYWYTLAAELDNINACYSLISLEQNTDIYLNKIKNINKKFNQDKFYILGKEYVSEKKFDKALESFSKSVIENTNFYSMYEMANIYRLKKKNIADANIWYKEACNYGDINALDYIYILEARKLKKIIPQYIKFDSAYTNYTLGCIYLRRNDTVKAITYLSKAAIQKSLQAHVELIKLFKRQDNTKNVQFWCSAATTLAALISTEQICFN